MRLNRKALAEARRKRLNIDGMRRLSSCGLEINGTAYWIVNIRWTYHAMKVGRRGLLVPVGIDAPLHLMCRKKLEEAVR